ncbi:MAG TPA: methionine--tRNA ligase subunit beta [Candidatus Norongarragalinales archaeon]|jgi:methionyl-tRNA synthetase|nr:methionine--tRNA ligase subunit beta [Candidatus Norongarragalinales archaeon]
MTNEHKPTIAYEDFSKLELRVATITKAERVPGADKLLKLTVRVGDEERVIGSAIAEWRAPEDLEGKKIVIVYNLAPRKIRGIESQGMLLAAEKDGQLSILTPDEDIEDGAEVH